MLIKSSRRLIKSSFVIEHWNPLLPQTQYVGYNDKGLAGVYDINDALQFNTKEEAEQFIKEHDKEYGGKLKIHEYPSYVQNSRSAIKSGVDKETLIERINEVEPDDYSDWSVEELQELAINLGISIKSSRKISSSVHVSDLTEQEKDDLYEIEKKEAEEHYNSLDDSDKQMLRIRYGIKNVKDYVKFFIVHPNKLSDDYEFIIDPRPKLNSRKSVKSSFVVGKTMDDGSKLYYCEDNCFYNENNYSRPSIKIFDSKREADKIAKRSKSGFVIPLEK